MLILVLLSLLGSASAQRFIFSSDRIRQEVASPLSEAQNDLYLFDAGSEIRLTSTPDLAEYDPSPSSDSQLVAYASTDFIAGVTDYEASWTWRYHVIDLNGRELASWDLPGAENTFRPAGGFDIFWLPDRSGFLAQGYDADGAWEIHRYFLDQTDSIPLTKGFGIVPSADGRFVVTMRAGESYLVEIETGLETSLGEGYPLGWAPDGGAVFLERNFALLLVPPTSPERTKLIGDTGPYLALAWNPTRSAYAYTTVHEDGSSAVYFHDRRNTFLGSYGVEGLADSFDWLDDERLVLEWLPSSEEHLIAVIDRSGNIAVLVDSAGSDQTPRMLRP
ncbi:MAG: hypothetical protein JSV66_05970 [Trueperaceae bacterium]|nr:MAG: hypothetical protein JSV66_05970 [Trueperaceae bacterium]